MLDKAFMDGGKEVPIEIIPGTTLIWEVKDGMASIKLKGLTAHTRYKGTKAKACNGSGEITDDNTQFNSLIGEVDPDKAKGEPPNKNMNNNRNEINPNKSSKKTKEERKESLKKNSKKKKTEKLNGKKKDNSKES